jgi:sugar-specific transcriptional regulator TrmB
VSQDKTLKSLMALGLTKAEAKVYFYLAKRGPKKASEIARALGMTRQQFYVVAGRLQGKAIVTATVDRPAKFFAVPLNKVLDLVAKAKFEEAKIIEANKGNLLSDWESIAIPAVEENTSKFTVIKGRNHVYSKIHQMIQESQSQISVISDVSGLFHAEQFEILDVMESNPKKQDIQFRIVTEVPSNYLNAVKDLLKTINPEIKIKARNTDIGLTLFPRMVIRDNKEILYFVSAKPDVTEDNNDDALFTNCSSLVKPLSTVFENLWQNSTDIEQKIEEMEQGDDPPRTLLIKDVNEAETKYSAIIKEAKNEILFVLPSDRLADLRKELQELKNQTPADISIRIMSPIVNENLKIVKELLAYGEVRHIPRNFTETTIIDGKHLFQFNESQFITEGSKGVPNINHVLYTNNGEYVRKTKSMLEYIWKNSTSPSITPIVSIVDSLDSFSLIPKSCSGYSSEVISDWLRSKPFERSEEKITEKEVLEKIFHLNRSSSPSKNVVECYTRFGYAAINPPEHFNLPRIIVETSQVDKKSSFGAEDRMTFYLWQKTQQGYNYVPVAIISNSESFPVDLLSTGELRNTPAEKNVYVLKKEEIHFQYYGNVFLASWTKPVPLVPGKLVLSPGTLIFETYGAVKPKKVVLRYPLGAVYEVYFNAFDAFVTFLYESSRYVGSGTDGLFLRDAYLEISVPETPN